VILQELQALSGFVPETALGGLGGRIGTQFRGTRHYGALYELRSSTQTKPRK
jgi:hypothetical protein